MRRMFVVLLVLLAVGHPALLPAQLPSAQEVYAKYAAAVGGLEAWRRVTGYIEKGTVTLEGLDMTGTIERRFALPNKSRVIMDFGSDRFEQLFDGETGWNDDGEGREPIPPDELKLMQVRTPDGAYFLTIAQFSTITVAAQTTFDGHDVYQLNATTVSGVSTIEYFDIHSGLRVGKVTKLNDGDFTSLYREYRAFDGKLVPSRILQGRDGVGRITIITDVIFGDPGPNAFKSLS